MTNYFELFNIDADFDVNLEKLSKQYRSLQQQYHPDKIASGDSELSEADALKLSSLVNDAYHTLASPDTRAAYLLSSAGQDARIDQSISDLTFLDQALELREQLDDADSEPELQSLKMEVSQWIEALSGEFKREFAEQDWDEACDTARKISFMVKVKADVQATFDKFDDIDDLDADLF